METDKKKHKAIFRVDIKDLSTRKIRGFNVYENGKRVSLEKFKETLMSKVKEI